MAPSLGRFAMTRRAAAGAMGALLSIAGCGGSNPAGPGTGPTPAPSATVHAVSAETGAPVAVTPATATLGQPLDVTAPSGFFVLRTTFDGRPVELWPDDPSLPVQYTAHLVYKATDGGALNRLRDGASVSIVMHDALAAPPFAEACQEAAGRASDADPDHGYSCGGAGTVTADVSLGDTRGMGMLAYAHYDGDGYIDGMDIVVASADVGHFWYGSENFTRGLLHEVGGHGAGLGHHEGDDEAGLMSATAELYRYATFTRNEKRILALLKHRHALTTLTANVEDATRSARTSRHRGGVLGAVETLSRRVGRADRRGETSWHPVCAALPSSLGR